METPPNFSPFESSRQQSEAEFHDRWAKTINVSQIDICSTFESPTATENQYILGLFGNLQGSRILDLGCGMGDAAIYFALQGATVHAIDISPGMVMVTQRLAERLGVAERVHAEQMPAETLRFADGYFDLVYGNGVLHHVDFMKTSASVYRVLKPGGMAAFIEPLTYNPVIWLYRLMARANRSQGERPLSAQDIRHFCQGVAPGKAAASPWLAADHREFHLFTLLIMVWFLVGEHISPSQERYWKRFVEQGPRYRTAFRILNALDAWCYRLLPPVRWLSWNTVITLKK